MEQWNKGTAAFPSESDKPESSQFSLESSNSFYKPSVSLYEFFCKRYIKEYGDEDDEGQPLKKTVENIEKKNGAVIESFDAFMKREKYRLTAMVDAIIGEADSLSLFISGNEYHFAPEDTLFLELCIETFGDADAQKLRKRKYEEIDDEYLNLLKPGILNLLSNLDTMHDSEFGERRWSQGFYQSYGEMMDAYTSLCSTMKLFIGLSNEVDGHVTLFQKVTKWLRACEILLRREAREMIEYPDFDFQDLHVDTDK